MKIKLLATLVCVVLLQAVNAQSSTADMVKDWERAKVYTKEYLDAMPDSGYALKPTPDMRSFAEQMMHLTEANYGFVAAASGKTPGPEATAKSTDMSKANVTKMVMAGYDFVISSARGMTAAQLKEPVKIFNRFDMTKEAAFAKCFEHQTHHRGQTTVYLRLAGVKPPQEKLF